MKNLTVLPPHPGSPLYVPPITLMEATASF